MPRDKGILAGGAIFPGRPLCPKGGWIRKRALPVRAWAPVLRAAIGWLRTAEESQRRMERWRRTADVPLRMMDLPTRTMYFHLRMMNGGQRATVGWLRAADYRVRMVDFPVLTTDLQLRRTGEGWRGIAERLQPVERGPAVLKKRLMARSYPRRALFSIPNLEFQCVRVEAPP